MITQEMRQKFGTIKPYQGSVHTGLLDLTHPKVKQMADRVLELFLNSPPEHFIGTFLYFYHIAPQQENPITVSAFEDTIATHPGQGRLIASYLRNENTIEALFIKLNNLDQERKLLESIALDYTSYQGNVYEYDNQNHHGISTKNFELYFYPTDVRLDYEKQKDQLMYNSLEESLPILWKFKSRENIKLGEGKTKTIVKCKNPRGFFESVAHLALGDFKNSKNYGIINK